MKKQAKNNLYFSLMQGFYWAACVTFNVFLVYYLETLHVPSSKIGILLTVGTISGVASQYFWGYLCDKQRGIKKVMSLCILGTVIAVLTLPSVQGFKAILSVYILFMFFQPVIPSLIDTWIIQSDELIRKNYSKIRSVGSLTFAVMSSFFGLLVEKYLYYAIALGFTLFSTLLLIIVLISKDIVKKERHVQKSPKPQLSAVSLFKNIRFVLFLLGIMLIFIPNSFISSYMFYIARSVNGTAREMSLAFGLAAVLEIPLFLMFERISRKLSLEKILVIGAVFLIGRILQLLLIKTPYGLYTNALFHGIGFPLITSCLRNYVPKIVPEDLIVTGQAIAGAFANGIPYIIAAYLGGIMLQSYDISSSYMLFAALGGIAFIPFICLVMLPQKIKI
jgi:PPP family 3-phenylpropionic acid transporter